MMPLNIIDLVVDYRLNRALNFIKEAKPSYIAISFMDNPVKRITSFFIAEVLSRSLHVHQPQKTVFDLVVNWIKNYDQATKSSGIYVHWFLANLIRLLGLEPMMLPGAYWLDLREGKTTSEEPIHPDKLRPEITSQIYLLFNHSEVYAPETSGRTAKSEVLEALLLYLRLHIPGFGTPKTLPVIREILE